MKILQSAAEWPKRLLCFFLFYKKGRNDEARKQLQNNNEVLQKQAEVAATPFARRNDIIMRMHNGKM